MEVLHMRNLHAICNARVATTTVRHQPWHLCQALSTALPYGSSQPCGYRYSAKTFMIQPPRAGKRSLDSLHQRTLILTEVDTRHNYRSQLLLLHKTLHEAVQGMAITWCTYTVHANKECHARKRHTKLFQSGTWWHAVFNLHSVALANVMLSDVQI